MDYQAWEKATRVGHFYSTPTNESMGLGLGKSDYTWGAVAIGLDGADREWFLALHDAVRDLARALWPPGAPVDVVTGEPPRTPEVEADAAPLAANVAGRWDAGRWDEVERRIEDDGSLREWFHSLADAVRELSEALAD